MRTYFSPVPVPAPHAVSPGVYREIYGMPAFATLIVASVQASVDWYLGIGFVALFTMPGPDGSPALVHLRRWAFQDLLVRPAPAAVSTGSGITLSFAAVLDELDPLVEAARAQGGGTASDPLDTPWTTRDVRTSDPDGNVVIFTAGRPLAEGLGVRTLP